MPMLRKIKSPIRPHNYEVVPKTDTIKNTITDELEQLLDDLVEVENVTRNIVCKDQNTFDEILNDP